MYYTEITKTATGLKLLMTYLKVRRYPMDMR
jgi:hypothetical protein